MFPLGYSAEQSGASGVGGVYFKSYAAGDRNAGMARAGPRPSTFLEALGPGTIVRCSGQFRLAEYCDFRKRHESAIHFLLMFFASATVVRQELDQISGVNEAVTPSNCADGAANHFPFQS